MGAPLLLRRLFRPFLAIPPLPCYIPRSIPLPQPVPASDFQLKFCGQTSLADARASATAGATMIGVIFYPRSKRYVPFAEAASWINEVPAGIERVAVFVDPTLAEVRAALADGLFHTAQLHGQETPEFFATLAAEGFGGRLIKALQIEDASSLETLDTFPTRRFLLDGPDPGSGRPFDWSLAATAVTRRPDAHFLLAGGLTPENVATAIDAVRPHGVDVATGIEAAPGRKDVEKMTRFATAVRETVKNFAFPKQNQLHFPNERA